MMSSANSNSFRTFPQGSVNCVWPYAIYPAPVPWAGDTAATYSWLSVALARCRRDQCMGPVVILNAPGYNNSWHPVEAGVTILSDVYRNLYCCEAHLNFGTDVPTLRTGCRSRCLIRPSIVSLGRSSSHCRRSEYRFLWMLFSLLRRYQTSASRLRWMGEEIVWLSGDNRKVNHFVKKFASTDPTSFTRTLMILYDDMKNKIYSRVLWNFIRLYTKTG